MVRVRLSLAAALAAALIASVPGGTLAAVPSGAATDGAVTSRVTVDKGYALVQLAGAPLSTYAKTKPAPGKKIDFSSANVKSYKAHLAAVRNQFKQWLHTAAPKAQVVKGYDLSLNAVAVKLNGTALATIAKSSLVVRAEYEGLYYPTSDPDLAAISAIEGWTNAGQTPATAGEGVKVGVIDTGIDVKSPCFSDAGYPAITQLGQKAYTNNKVFVARVFNNKLNQNGFDAAPVQEHGTHVAGTIACDFDTPASVDGVAIPYGISGVAPHALLGNYNIFPGDVLNARSEDILNALDAAYADGMDIVNMSLGGGQKGIQDLVAVAVDNLDQANMISAVAAGNSGPGFSTVESPGSASRALTAGASTVGHFVGTPLTVGAASYGLAAGDFSKVESDLTAPLGVAPGGTAATGGLGTACAALAPNSMTGKIAVISRGVCSFTTKVRFAQDAGAVAAVIVNNAAGDPVAMATDGTLPAPTIPAYMASLADRPALAAADGQTATISAVESYFQTTNTDIMAGFSSQGPTNVDFRVKPDVVAPGVNVLSSIPNSFCDGQPCFAFFQGTSMATPHLAGVAAILVQQHPTWPAWAIRSAVVNTADTGVLTSSANGTSTVTDVNITGSGRVNLASATTAQVVLDPVSVSFGATPSGSGQTRSYTVTMKNVTDSTATFGLAIAAWGATHGVTFSVDRPSVTLASGTSATFHVVATFAKTAPAGSNQAWLNVSVGNSIVAHAAVYALVK